MLQLGKVNRLLLAELARQAPLLPGKETLAFVDTGAMQKRVYGHQEQGAAFGHTKIQGKSLLVRGPNALAATISTPLGAPVVAATRLRGGNASSARGEPRPSLDQPDYALPGTIPITAMQGPATEQGHRPSP